MAHMQKSNKFSDDSTSLALWSRADRGIRGSDFDRGLYRLLDSRPSGANRRWERPPVAAGTGTAQPPSRHGRRRPTIHVLFFCPTASKTRGWSAYADHDGGGTVRHEPDTPRRFPERLSASRLSSNRDKRPSICRYRLSPIPASPRFPSVMPGLVPGIHVLPRARPLPAVTAMRRNVDARNKSGVTALAIRGRRFRPNGHAPSARGIEEGPDGPAPLPILAQEKRQLFGRCLSATIFNLP